MSVTILAKKEYTPVQVLASMEAPGKTRGRGAGGWVHDLCALKKVITLCPFCTHKFNPGRLGYIKEKEFPVVVANCDGCTVFDTKCSAYFFEETYKTVRSTANDRRAERTAHRKRVAKLNS
jgi:hypothetical protein